MKTPSQHIEYVRSKPHHVRRRVAFVTALSATSFIALIWFVSQMSAGVFALEGNSFADSQNQSGVTNGPAATAPSGLAAAAAADPSRDADAPAHIEIVDAKPAATPNRQAEATILPF